MKDINRRLIRLEQTVKSRPFDAVRALVQVQAAVEGLEGEQRVMKAMGASKQVAPEHFSKVFLAWTRTLPDNEAKFARDFIKQFAERARALQEGRK